MDPKREVSTEFSARFSRIERIDETGSTNADLLDRARSGEVGDLVLIADHQNQGRGRQGRAWLDQPGASLLMSVLLGSTPPIDQHDLGLVPLAAGIAVKDGVDALGVGASGIDCIGLKWPNDVLVSRGDRTERGSTERKLAGILTEAVRTPDGLAVVAGIGVNVDMGPVSERPSEVVELAVDLRELVESPPTPDDLASMVLAAFAYRLHQLDTDRAGFLDAYRTSCLSIGRMVQLDHPGGPVAGQVIAIADDGALTLATDDGEKHFTAGDVHHRR